MFDLGTSTASGAPLALYQSALSGPPSRASAPESRRNTPSEARSTDAMAAATTHSRSSSVVESSSVQAVPETSRSDEYLQGKDPSKQPEIEYKPDEVREEHANRIEELAKQYEETLQRLGQFFKAEDLQDPPSPREIQQRLVETVVDRLGPTSRALSEPIRLEPDRPQPSADGGSKTSDPLNIVV